MKMRNHIRKSLLSLLAAAAMTIAAIPAFPAAAQETKLIALTFDDGPNTTTTNEVLDILEQYNAKASFFLIGDNINAESAVSVKRAYDMGMEIDNHSKTHSNMSKMTPEEIQAEIAYVDEKVTEIIGEPTKFFRPPFIDTSDTMYDAIEIPFICGIDCQDYMPNVGAEERAQYILDGARDGVIVLLHDAAGNDNTVEALKIAMPELAAQGYEFVTLTELFRRQGETPKRNLIYTTVAKYPCTDYTLYKEIEAGPADRIPLDAALLASLGDTYAIEVSYSGNPDPPVAALQSWTANPPIWHAVQPFYSNGDRAVFLASDLLGALEEIGAGYTDLDGITLSAYGGEITLTDARILVKGEPAETVAGDVTGDGACSMLDVVALQKWLVCAGSISGGKAGDLNADGVIDILDLALLKAKVFA